MTNQRATWADLHNFMLTEARKQLAPRNKADRTAHVNYMEGSLVIDSTAILDDSNGAIELGDYVRVGAGAKIVGPVAIGDNTIIGDRALLRGPLVIGKDCLVGFSAELKSAHIGRRVAIGPMCYVADSTLDDDVYLGAMVRTSNHRLDRQNVKVVHEGTTVDTGMKKLGCHIGARSSLGVQCIVLPGRIIAPDSQFGPRITIEKNLPSGRYRLRQEIESY